MVSPQKKSVNLSLDASLVGEARTAGLNISRIAEEALRSRLAEVAARRWRDEHAEAIEAYNRDIEQRGTFGSTLPGWWNADGPI